MLMKEVRIIRVD